MRISQSSRSIHLIYIFTLIEPFIICQASLFQLISSCTKLAVPLSLTPFCCCCLVVKSCPALLQAHGLQPTGLICLWGFPGKNTGVGSHSLLQGIVLTQRLNLRLLHWQANSLALSYLEALFRPFYRSKWKPRGLLIYLSHLTCPSSINVSGTVTLGCVILSKVSSTSFQSRSLKPSLTAFKLDRVVCGVFRCISSAQFSWSVVSDCMTPWITAHQVYR